MVSELIYPNTARAVSLASGHVEISDAKNPRKKTKVAFTDVTVAGDTIEEMRESFLYSKAFRWDKRAPIRELERSGLVRLLDLDIIKPLGLGRGEHPVPLRCIDDELI